MATKVVFTEGEVSNHYAEDGSIILGKEYDVYKHKTGENGGVFIIDETEETLYYKSSCIGGEFNVEDCVMTYIES